MFNPRCMVHLAVEWMFVYTTRYLYCVHDTQLHHENAIANCDWSSDTIMLCFALCYNVVCSFFTLKLQEFWMTYSVSMVYGYSWSCFGTVNVSVSVNASKSSWHTKRVATTTATATAVAVPTTQQQITK